MNNRFLAGSLALLLVGLAWYFHLIPGLRPSVKPPVVAVEVTAPKAVVAETPAPVVAVAPAPAPAVAPAPLAAVVRPSFDIVRVQPSGEVVVAGRGAPNAVITLLGDGKPLDTAKTDASGQFAMIPQPLIPGPHSLTLSMKGPDGVVVVSEQAVTVDVPDTAKGQVVVALAQPGKATELLAPLKPVTVPPPPVETATPAPTGPPRDGVVIGIVEAEDSGTLYVTGSAAPGASVRLYLNESYLATAEVGADGRWSLKIAKGVTPGQYRVRVDDIDPATGKVLSRAEVAFDFAAKVAETTTPSVEPGTSSTVVIESINTATVTRGDSLWRISRRIYGAGYRYTVIHEANTDQIRNPNLIYPGQVFVLPKLP